MQLDNSASEAPVDSSKPPDYDAGRSQQLPPLRGNPSPLGAPSSAKEYGDPRASGNPLKFVDGKRPPFMAVTPQSPRPLPNYGPNARRKNPLEALRGKPMRNAPGENNTAVAKNPLLHAKRKQYFDSGDWILQKAGFLPSATVGTAIPQPESIPHPHPYSGQYSSTSPTGASSSSPTDTPLRQHSEIEEQDSEVVEEHSGVIAEAIEETPKIQK